jgi:hypothetical protein
MDYNHIISSLKTRFHDHRYHVTNVYIFRHDWESDYFSIARTGMAYEVEVKVSLSDFRADFKKPKHRLMSDYKSGYIITRGHEHHVSWNPEIKACWVNVQKIEEAKIPNRFYFCSPVDVIPVSEVPHYAGLIYVNDRHSMIIKQAPFLHKGHGDYRQTLLDKYYYRSIKLEQQVRDLQYALKQR